MAFTKLFINAQGVFKSMMNKQYTKQIKVRKNKKKQNHIEVNWIKLASNTYMWNYAEKKKMGLIKCKP